MAINNFDKSLVFDVSGGAPVVGAAVYPFKWHGGDNQRWRFNTLD